MTNGKLHSQGRVSFSPIFLFMAVLFCTCLIVSNLIASKVFVVLGVTLPAAVIVFPVSYILNDCLCEVYGYRRARLVICLGFLMNFFMVIVTQLAILLPGAVFWQGDEAFRSIFGATPRATIASLLAFWAGSTLNAWVMSRMKVFQQGRHFWLRAILSSVVGECADSLIFIPIMFWAMGWQAVGIMMLCQVSAKVLYEIVILPVTKWVVQRVKQLEQLDTFDNNISYNPFKILDL
ncbi:MAG: queuosine precursor transporter [Bacteroidales bacterium]|nr:queuosine precursor transporter [Bacteroidales bacterium]